MKWIALAAACAAATGCRDEPAPTPLPPIPSGPTTVIQLPRPEVTDLYRADITTVCDAIRLSGADQKPENERWPVVAIWLGPQIKTAQGHEFLVAIQPLAGEAKAAALDAEARRVGLTECALAATWR
jgi:hypothetical protein